MKKLYIYIFVIFNFLQVYSQIQNLDFEVSDSLYITNKSFDLTIYSDPVLKLTEIGKLKMRPSKEINSSAISIGFECLDRQIFDPNKCYDKLGKTGVKWARCQTGWNRCEKTKGVYDFEWLDDVVNNLLKRGIKPWFNVGFGNKIYMPNAYGEAVGWNPICYGPDVMNAWGNYVEALTNHFKGRITHYEIWNEPNISVFWQPGEANALDYYKFIEYTSKKIKKVDKNAKIGGCVSGSICDFVVRLVGLGVSNYIDFFSIHPYRIIPEKNYINEIKALRHLFNENKGSHVKLWQGESGFGSYFPLNHFLRTWVRGSERMQAKWLLRRYMIDLSLNLEMSSFFQMVDMTEKEYTTSKGKANPCLHGILHGKSYLPKDAYYAISFISSIFDDKVSCEDFYFNVDLGRRRPFGDRVSRLEDISIVTNTFSRSGYPLFIYYLPEDIQMDYKGMTDIDVRFLNTGVNPIKNPVLIDMLSGRIFSIDDYKLSDRSTNYEVVFKHLPLTDYPIIITDINAIKECMQQFPSN